MKSRRALVVGVDAVKGSALRSCCNDAIRVGGLLSTHEDGSPNWKVHRETARSIHIPVVTTSYLTGLLIDLFTRADGDDILFYFSGHGMKSPLGVELVTQDGFIPGRGISFGEVMTLAESSPAETVTIILDCCFSGAAANDLRPADPFRMSRATIRDNLVILSSSQSTETATASGALSDFTELLLDGLQGAAADQRGVVTALDLFIHTSRARHERTFTPQLKANSTGLPTLRATEPSVPAQLLRMLPELFPDPDIGIQLSPEHEGEGRPLAPGEATPEQQLFDHLSTLRNAKLVHGEQSRSHYWLAMNRGTVTLNREGRYLWSLAKSNLI